MKIQYFGFMNKIGSRSTTYIPTTFQKLANSFQNYLLVLFFVPISINKVGLISIKEKVTLHLLSYSICSRHVCP